MEETKVYNFEKYKKCKQNKTKKLLFDFFNRVIQEKRRVGKKIISVSLTESYNYVSVKFTMGDNLISIMNNKEEQYELKNNNLALKSKEKMIYQLIDILQLKRKEYSYYSYYNNNYKITWDYLDIDFPCIICYLI